MNAVAFAQSGSFARGWDYARRNYVADAVVHAVTIAAAVTGAITLAVAASHQAELGRAVALLVYGQCLVLTLTLSAAYNLNRDPARTERLRCRDHAGIFAMIAGTYTPLAAFGLSAGEGGALLAVMWAAAVMGATIKLRCPRRYERTGIATYLALGWVLLPMLGPLGRVMPPTSLGLLGAGLAIYTLGVGFHLARRLPYHTPIWHVCVLAGAACQFLAIYSFAAA